MNSSTILRSSVGHLSIKHCKIYSPKYKSTNSKKEDLKINIKMKTPIGNVNNLTKL